MDMTIAGCGKGMGFALAASLLFAGAAQAAGNAATRNVIATPGVRGESAMQPQGNLQCPVIADNAYDGTLASMTCVDVPGIDQTVTATRLHLGVQHPFAGDLVVKVVNPAGQVVTVLNRPNLPEPADDGSACCGTQAGLSAAFPVVFDDASTGPAAEQLGASLRDAQVACRDDGTCSFKPSAGSATPGTLAAFNGTSGAGTWKVCVGDAESLESGGVCSAVLAFNGLEADLSVNLQFPMQLRDDTYELTVDAFNRGPAAQQGVNVSNVLSDTLDYVDDDCGGAANGRTWSWHAGTLAADAHALCHVRVRSNAAANVCPSFEVAASIGGDVADPDPSNNTIVASNGDENVVADPSLESSAPAGGGAWTSTSSNFGHVFCARGRCSDSAAMQPYDGEWWAWFGGIDPAYPGDTAFPETATLRQMLVIPAGTATLDFQLRAPVCSGSAADYLALTVDGVERWRTDATNTALCGGGYAEQSVDVSAAADGAPHVVEFRAQQTGQGGATSFFVDELSLVAPRRCGAGDVTFRDGFDNGG